MSKRATTLIVIVSLLLLAPAAAWAAAAGGAAPTVQQRPGVSVPAVNPTITVTSPTAAFAGKTGETLNISWSYLVNPGQNVKITLYRNSQAVQVIAPSVPLGAGGQGQFAWKIPDSLNVADSKGFTVEVASVEKPNVKDVSEPFTISAGKPAVSAQAAATAQVTGEIAVSQPAPGAVWQPGSSHFVKWSHSGLVGKNVKISLYRGSQLDRVLVSSMPTGEEEGSFGWEVPDDITQAANYSIQIQSVEIPARKAVSANFRIHGRLTVAEPGSGDTWTPGTTQIIRWTSSAVPGQNVKVTLLENGNPTDTLVSSIAAGSGMAAWDIPNGKAQASTYAIRLQSVEYPFITATSADFKLKGKITITSPPAGQDINNGTILTVKGEAYGVSAVKVAFGSPQMVGNTGFYFKELVSFNVPVVNKQFSQAITLVNLYPNVIHAVIVSSQADPGIEAIAGGLVAH